MQLHLFRGACPLPSRLFLHLKPHAAASYADCFRFRQSERQWSGAERVGLRRRSIFRAQACHGQSSVLTCPSLQ